MAVGIAIRSRFGARAILSAMTSSLRARHVEHSWRGRRATAVTTCRRILAVLREIDADVVALQEVAPLGLEDDLLQAVRDDLGMHVVTGRTLTRRNADYGNALLSRYPGGTQREHRPHRRAARAAQRHRRAPRVRAARCASLRRTSGCVPPSGASKCKRILAALDTRRSAACVVMGDLNEWYLWGRPLRWLHARFAVIAHAGDVPRAPADSEARPHLGASDERAA